jgi:hypothetical protein
MNVLVDVRKETWARVKYFATTESLTLSDAVERLLINAFSKEDMNLDDGK